MTYCRMKGGFFSNGGGHRILVSEMWWWKIQDWMQPELDGRTLELIVNRYHKTEKRSVKKLRWTEVGIANAQLRWRLNWINQMATIVRRCTHRFQRTGLVVWTICEHIQTTIRIQSYKHTSKTRMGITNTTDDRDHALKAHLDTRYPGSEIVHWM